jgi:exodeoxyribonuclease-3
MRGGMKIVTWNVNGLRAVLNKGFLDWLKAEKADVVCLQEIKVKPEQIPDGLVQMPGYHSYWFSAKKPGYSGTAILAKQKPDEIWEGIDQPHAKDEGRVLGARFGNLQVLSAYYPNSQEGGARKDVKLEFCEAIHKKVDALVKKKQDVVLCGDYNIAHMEIDLARPKENEENPGFFPWERDAMTKFLAAGYVDIFREQHPGEKDHYSWWSFRSAARERNVGWRIDYTCLSPSLRSRAKETFIKNQVFGSDHCPVGVVLK